MDTDNKKRNPGSATWEVRKVLIAGVDYHLTNQRVEKDVERP